MEDKIIISDSHGTYIFQMAMENNPPPHGPYRLPTYNLKTLERMAIMSALFQANYCQEDASSLLGISARVLNYKIKKHRITHASWRVNV